MTAPKRYPVVEIFGPTIQGEGPLQGRMCHFIRLGGCDFRCSWCDTPYAVLPKEVRENAIKMDAETIVSELDDLSAVRPLVVISGGNPALHELGTLIDVLRSNGYSTSVETQGTRWKDWIADVDAVTVSPKPPSAGMGDTLPGLADFMENVYGHPNLCLKVVVFNEQDLDYAREVVRQYPLVPSFLSAGNDAGRSVGNPTRQDSRTSEEVRSGLIHSWQELIELAAQHPEFRNTQIQAQAHVLLWGNERGR